MTTNHQKRERSIILGRQTVLHKRAATLTDAELQWLQRVARDAKAGICTLKALSAEQWVEVLSKRSFGRRVKRAVEAGLIIGLELRHKGSDRSWRYEVLATVTAANALA